MNEAENKPPGWPRSMARIIAMIICCTAGASCLLISLLFLWTTVDQFLGGIPQPAGYKLDWKVPAIGLLFAAAFFLLAAAFAYFAISRWFPQATPRTCTHDRRP